MLVPLLAAGAVVAYLVLRKPTAGAGALPGVGNGVTVQGKSGTIYLTAPNLNPMPVAPGTKVTDVFLAPSGTRVMSFAQSGSDMNSRLFLSSSLQPNDPILITAKADFL